MESTPFEIDLDWEFDAPHWCDFTKEDNGLSDDWFDKIEKQEEEHNKNEFLLNETKQISRNATQEKEMTHQTTPTQEKKHSKIPIPTRRVIRSGSVTKVSPRTRKDSAGKENINLNRIPIHSKIPTMRSSSRFNLQRQGSGSIATK